MGEETPKRRPGRPATGVDPVRGVRVPDKRWEKFDEATKAAGTDKSKAVNDLIGWFVREPNAKLPKRPDPAPEPSAGEGGETDSDG